MQETIEAGATNPAPWNVSTEQGLYTLLALVGARRMSVDALHERTRLPQSAFWSLMTWLKKGQLVELVSTSDVDGAKESVELTERGEGLLVSLLERTCELPELR